ncbi:hypothetical protein C8R43DRAFT_1119275 [Mycena crocata]|nr:hypothetical protein C8R43DRAFT_1119275 [Mycena crocata]
MHSVSDSPSIPPLPFFRRPIFPSPTNAMPLPVFPSALGNSSTHSLRMVVQISEIYGNLESSFAISTETHPDDPYECVTAVTASAPRAMVYHESSRLRGSRSAAYEPGCNTLCPRIHAPVTLLTAAAYLCRADLFSGYPSSALLYVYDDAFTLLAVVALRLACSLNVVREPAPICDFLWQIF